MHRIRGRRGLGAVRALWEARDELAERRDVTPGRIIPDSAIVAAAQPADRPRRAAGGQGVPRPGRRAVRLALGRRAPRGREMPEEPSCPPVPPARRTAATPAPGPTATRSPPAGSAGPAARSPSWPRSRGCRSRTCSPPTTCAGCCGPRPRPASPPTWPTRCRAQLRELGARPWQVELVHRRPHRRGADRRRRAARGDRRRAAGRRRGPRGPTSRLTPQQRGTYPAPAHVRRNEAGPRPRSAHVRRNRGQTSPAGRARAHVRATRRSFLRRCTPNEPARPPFLRRCATDAHRSPRHSCAPAQPTRTGAPPFRRTCATKRRAGEAARSPVTPTATRSAPPRGSARRATPRRSPRWPARGRGRRDR